jgi:hypothetical protein
VGDVVRIAAESLERVPPLLDPLWREVAAAVCPTEHGHMVLLDIARLLDFGPKQRAAG